MRIWQVDDGFEIQYEKPCITNEELQREYDYYLADQLTKKGVLFLQKPLAFKQKRDIVYLRTSQMMTSDGSDSSIK